MDVWFANSASANAISKTCHRYRSYVLQMPTKVSTLFSPQTLTTGTQILEIGRNFYIKPLFGELWKSQSGNPILVIGGRGILWCK